MRVDMSLNIETKPNQCSKLTWLHTGMYNNSVQPTT